MKIAQLRGNLEIYTSMNNYTLLRQHYHHHLSTRIKKIFNAKLTKYLLGNKEHQFSQ